GDRPVQGPDRDLPVVGRPLEEGRHQDDLPAARRAGLSLGRFPHHGPGPVVSSRTRPDWPAGCGDTTSTWYAVTLHGFEPVQSDDEPCTVRADATGQPSQ